MSWLDNVRLCYTVLGKAPIFSPDFKRNDSQMRLEEPVVFRVEDQDLHSHCSENLGPPSTHLNIKMFLCFERINLSSCSSSSQRKLLQWVSTCLPVLLCLIPLRNLMVVKWEHCCLLNTFRWQDEQAEEDLMKQELLSSCARLVFQIWIHSQIWCSVSSLRPLIVFNKCLWSSYILHLIPVCDVHMCSWSVVCMMCVAYSC